jgi:hypothetical protein
MMEIYNDAILRFMQQIKWNGKAVPCVWSGGDRAYAQIREWYKRERNVEISVSSGEASIPRPFMAAWRDPFVEAKELSGQGIYRITPNKNSSFGYAMRSPSYVKSKCEVNIYCKDLTQSGIIEFQLRRLFVDGWSGIPVDFTDSRWYQPPNDVFSFAKILGYQDLLLQEDSLVDNSSLEDSGLRQSEIRLTFTFTLFGWIPHQYYSVPVAHGIVCEFIDKVSEETIFKAETEPE